MKYIVPDRNFRDPVMVERHLQEALRFILAGIRADRQKTEPESEP